MHVSDGRIQQGGTEIGCTKQGAVIRTLEGLPTGRAYAKTLCWRDCRVWIVEITQKTWTDCCIRWSSRTGEFPAGDPELHHVAGTLYAEGQNLVKCFGILRVLIED